MDECPDRLSHLRASGLTPGQSTKTLSATWFRRKRRKRKKEREREEGRKERERGWEEGRKKERKKEKINK